MNNNNNAIILTIGIILNGIVYTYIYMLYVCYYMPCILFRVQRLYAFVWPKSSGK